MNLLRLRLVSRWNCRLLAFRYEAPEGDVQRFGVQSAVVSCGNRFSADEISATKWRVKDSLAHPGLRQPKTQADGQNHRVEQGRTRGLGWLEALHPKDVEPIMKALHTGSSIDVEFRVKSIDRGWRWMRFRGSPSFGPSCQIVRWHGSVEDVDARKQ